jgi:HEAT repeat protein
MIPVPVAPFVAQLRDPDEDVLFWALVGLKRIGKRSAPALQEIGQLALRNPAFGVRQVAVGALSRVAPSDPRTIRTLRKAFADESPFVRRSALQGAIDARGLSAADLRHIARLGDDPDEAVASSSEIALRNIRIREKRREARLRRLASQAGTG